MWGTIFKKKSFFKDDDNNDDGDDNDDDDVKVRKALTGAKKRQAKNNNKHTFSHVCRCRRDSRNLSCVCGVFSRRQNHSKLLVFQAAGARGDDSSKEMRM